MNLKEYKPALRFLLIFVGSYFTLNLLYGVWIESLGNEPDKATYWVSSHTKIFLNTLGFDAWVSPNPDGPTIRLKNGEQVVLNIFEGCNGINVMIVFLSFVWAFAAPKKRWAWFIPMGLVVIHFANILRISLLYWFSEKQQNLFHYFHKYFFTAAIYAIVFILWWWWVRLAQEDGRHETQ